jgi:hypothetical protein
MLVLEVLIITFLNAIAKMPNIATLSSAFKKGSSQISKQKD